MQGDPGDAAFQAWWASLGVCQADYSSYTLCRWAWEAARAKPPCRCETFLVRCVCRRRGKWLGWLLLPWLIRSPRACDCSGKLCEVCNGDAQRDRDAVAAGRFPLREVG